MSQGAYTRGSVARGGATVASVALWYTLPRGAAPRGGWYTVDGTAPAGASASVTLPAETLALTDYAPSITTPSSAPVAIPAETLALTDYAPSITTPSSAPVAIPAETLALTDYALAVAAAEAAVVALPAETLALTDYTPTTPIAVPAETVALSDPAIVVRYAALVNLIYAWPVDQLTLTDYAITIGQAAAATPEQLYWVLDITGGAADLRLPISSFQCTLQLDRSQYVQAVVPAVGDYIDELTTRQTAGGEFVISARTIWSDGSATETELTRAPLDQIRHDRGATRWSATLSAYTTAATAASGTRALTGIRSISVQGATLRVRCAADWDLRPGNTVTGAGYSFSADYVNYNVNASDAYMDVGKRAA